MILTASITNSYNINTMEVTTEGNAKKIHIASKDEGYGSSVSGGELLLLALSTCYCNDVYREAIKKEMIVESVNVEVTGEFGGVGMPGRNIVYKVDIKAPKHSLDEINDLILHVDKVAEIHNTLRKGVNVSLTC